MRVPKSLLVGLAWFDPDQPGGEIQLRHEAQSRDGLIFGWEAHDGRSFGRQELVDGPLHLTTHLVSRSSSGDLLVAFTPADRLILTDILAHLLLPSPFEG